MSRLRTWLNSWASTPWISSPAQVCSSPSVTHTAALSGLRPVAKALGWGWGETQPRIGIPSPLGQVGDDRVVLGHLGCGHPPPRAERMARRSLNQ